MGLISDLGVEGGGIHHPELPTSQAREQRLCLLPHRLDAARETGQRAVVVEGGSLLDFHAFDHEVPWSRVRLRFRIDDR